MFRALILAAALSAAVPAAASETPADPAVVEVVVTREGGGGRIVFDLPGNATVWAFPDSAVSAAEGLPWRPASWRILTPGVRLIRRNDIDALVLDPGASRRVEIDYDLYSAGLRAAYEPAITFAGGDAALYTGQYRVAPLTDETGMDAGEEALPAADQRITFRQPGVTLLAHGRSSPDELTFSTDEGRTYVFMGLTPLVETADVAAVIDSGLPRWAQDDARRVTPVLLDWFRSRLGPGLEQRPTLYLAWNGPQGQGISIGGGALPGLITLQASGQQMVEFNPLARHILTGIIAHETSHFWLGQGIDSENSVTEAWVHEGGADALSFRGIRAVEPSTDITQAFQQSLDRCQTFLKRGPLNTAIQRGDQRANYNCGAVFHLAAEKTLQRERRDADILDFWRELLDASRADGDFNQADWLALFRAHGGPQEASDIIARLAAEGSQAPDADLARLFDLSGVAYSRAEDGKLVLSPVDPA